MREFFASRRYPELLVILFVLFVVDCLIADPIPFLDEAILAVLTAAVGSRRKQALLVEDSES